MTRAIIDTPPPPPAAQQPDCPQFVLRCDRCGAVASWLVPHPLFQSLVRELAGRVGWVGALQGETVCPDCRTPVALAQHDRRAKQRIYSDDLVQRLCQLKCSGASYTELAAMASAEQGRKVTKCMVYQALRKWGSAAAA